MSCTHYSTNNSHPLIPLLVISLLTTSLLLTSCSSNRLLPEIESSAVDVVGASKVTTVAILREDSSQVTFKVNYYYDGSFGEVYYKGRKQKVALLALQPLKNGKSACKHSKPAVIKEGNHLAYSTLSLEGFANRTCHADRMAVLMYMPRSKPVTIGVYDFEREPKHPL